MAGGHAWWGACMVVEGVHGGGRAWQGTCVAGGVHCWGGMHGGGGACMPQQLIRDTVNERAVRILLECILVCKLAVQQY